MWHMVCADADSIDWNGRKMETIRHTFLARLPAGRRVAANRGCADSRKIIPSAQNTQEELLQ
jgi:hypothetical protein